MTEVCAPYFDIAKIADSGQCFRLNADGDGKWTLTAYGKVLHITETAPGTYAFSCSRKEFDALWRGYFDLDTDYVAFSGRIPKSDRFLTEAARYAEGVRILNQDPWEMLITFLISQRKSIPAIKTCVEKLAAGYGTPVTDGGKTYYAFPTPAQLCTADAEHLCGCSLGYRVPYVAGAAQLVASGELDLNRLKDLNDADLLSALLSVKGVGIKVANCVMLFGYHRIGAFPVDVWIARVIEKCYGGKFPLRRYAGCAGIIQQYIFFYGRSSLGRVKLDKKESLG